VSQIEPAKWERAAINASDHIVLIVDDDGAVRETLEDLLAAAGLYAVSFGSAAEYIAFSRPNVPTCVVLDVELPDINGLDLQEQLITGNHPPIIFITGHGDIPSSVRAIKAGALDFLIKPFDGQNLLQLLRSALDQDRARRIKLSEINHLKHRYETLTSRERDVLPLVVSGLLNKQAAARLGISEITLQIHRTNVMRKMNADSLAALVRMAGALDIPVTFARRT
jgi:FixJ family two-component response regulator